MRRITTVFFIAFNLVVLANPLEGYLKVATEENPSVKASYKQFEAALQKVAQAKGMPDPKLSLGYFISPVETRVGAQQAKLSLSQMFPWFGTLKAKGNGAKALANAQYQRFIDVKNKVGYRISKAYYELLELSQHLTIEQQNIQLLQSYQSVAQQQFKNGKTAMVDVLRIDIMLKSAETNYTILKAKEKPLRVRFNNLLNKPDTTKVEIGNLPAIEALYKEDEARPVSENPLLQELKLKQKAAKAQEEAAIKQGLPSFSVGIDYVTVADRTDMVVPNSGQDVLMPMVSMSLPLFRKKHNAAKKEQKLMQKAYALQKEALENDLTSAYEMAHFELQKQRDLIALYTEQIATSGQSLNLLFKAYSTSGKNFEEVLRMQQQLLRYQKMKVTSQVALHTIISQLKYLTAKNN